MSRYHEDVDEMADAYEMGDGEDDMDEELRGRGMGDSDSDDEEYGQSVCLSSSTAFCMLIFHLGALSDLFYYHLWLYFFYAAESYDHC